MQSITCEKCRDKVLPSPLISYAIPKLTSEKRGRIPALWSYNVPAAVVNVAVAVNIVRGSQIEIVEKGSDYRVVIV